MKQLLVAILFAAICFYPVFKVDASASSSSSLRELENSKHYHYSDEYRRNLLANGLGLTPPMGLASTLRDYFLSVAENSILPFMI